MRSGCYLRASVFAAKVGRPGDLLLSRQNLNSTVLIGVALALPVILLLMQISFSLSREREQLRAATIARAERVTALSRARLDADFALMQVFASSAAMERRDWPAAHARASQIADLTQHWRDVVVSDLQTGEEIFSTRRPFGARAPVRAEIARAGQAISAPTVGLASREGPGCPCIYVHAPVPGDVGRYLLTVGLDPIVFHTILMRQAAERSVEAIVDRQGFFIARSIAHADRIGTPATHYVRRAVESGGESGIYEGTTWEGLRNHSAYFTAGGISTHIAIPSQVLDTPRTFSIVATGVAALLTLALAAGLVFYSLNEMNRRRLAEARAAQTQKLEAIGQLTGGVAHDFNNLLTVIIGGLNMLLKRMDDPKQREIAQHMLDAAQRGDKLTKQLLAFSRGQQAELTPVDLQALAPGMEDLLRRSIDPNISLAFRIGADARWVTSDANQLELAILNLVINARDAMPDGGRIEIASAPAQEGFIALSVTDTGVGMPKEVADRALEPFFTTKPAGKGTGLGLAQVFGAARQSGGSVEIDSVAGRGTTVRLLLPRAAPPRDTASAPASSSNQSAAPAGGQRVLIVEDEPGVRAFMTDALRQAGYEVFEAAHPGAALQLLETAPPQLLLTDYSMPGMTGLELAERARAARGDLRVLMVSGYADAESVQDSPARPALLRKPFDEAALLDAVRAALTSE